MRWILRTGGRNYNRVIFNDRVNFSHMSLRPLPLNALRIFIAVTRYGGVSRAAEALNLTHSAVSHQIRALQEELGVTLFEKRGRGLALASEALSYAARIDAAFSEIEQATRELAAGRGTRLRISTIPSFAARWLMPRFGDFIASCPEIDVEVESSLRVADIKGGEIDIAIRFGSGHYPGLHTELLMRDWLFPVCSPEFAHAHRLGEPASIDGLPLLHSDNEPWSWWFAAAGIVAEEPEHGLMFSDSALMLQAAVTGQGLGLARQTIAGDEIRAGLLVRPFRALAESPHSYFFVCRKDKLETPAVVKFRDWIFKQAAEFPAPE